jgi:hypothetical protein
MMLHLGKHALRAIRPSLWAARTANRQLAVPGTNAADNAARLEHMKRQLEPHLRGISDGQRELLLLSVAHEHDRLASLDGKGLAVIALPSAVTAIAVLMIGHGIAPTIFALGALGYLGCAMYSVALIYRPRPRETFGVTDALAADSLTRLVAATRINQPIGTVANNIVVSVLLDSFRAVSLLIVGGAVLGLQHFDHAPRHDPAHRPIVTVTTSTSVTRSDTASSAPSASASVTPTASTSSP